MPYKNPPALYSIWLSMRRRCNNPNDAYYANYGGRGITVCERWQNDYKAFESDMGERPEGFSIERIDNEKGYYPENCKWASKKEQQRNRRVNVKVVVEGISYLAIDLANINKIKVETVVRRANLGYSYNAVIASSDKDFVDGFAIGKAAISLAKKAKTHCKRGHEYTEETMRIDANGARQCRLCHNLRAKERYAKKVAISKISTYTE